MRHRILPAIALVFFGCLPQSLWSDGPADNRSDQVRPIPPLGVELTEQQRLDLQSACSDVRSRWAKVLEDAQQATDKGNKWQRAKAVSKLEALRKLTPEVLVFPRAIELTIRFQQFYKEAEIENAKGLIEEPTAESWRRRIHPTGRLWSESNQAANNS